MFDHPTAVATGFRFGDRPVVRDRRLVVSGFHRPPDESVVAEALARGAATRSQEAIVSCCGCAVKPAFWSSHPQLGGVAAPHADRQSTYCQVQPLP